MQKTAITLSETVIVLAVVAILASFTIVSVRALNGSYNRIDERMVSSLLSAGRRIAVNRCAYAGVAFRYVNDMQYAAFVIADPNMMRLPISIEPEQKSIPFIAVAGHQVIKLHGHEAIVSVAVIDKADIESDDDHVAVIFDGRGRLVRKWIVFYRRSDVFGELLPLDSAGYLSDSSIAVYNPDLYEKQPDKSSYLQQLKIMHINTYTGQIIHAE